MEGVIRHHSSVSTLSIMSCRFWWVVSCFQFYRNLWHPYCYFCNDWWKRCSLYQATSVFSFISSRHSELCERHWRSEVLRLKKPVCCANKIQGQGQYQYGTTVQFRFCQKLRECLLSFFLGKIKLSPLYFWVIFNDTSSTKVYTWTPELSFKVKLLVFLLLLLLFLSVLNKTNGIVCLSIYFSHVKCSSIFFSYHQAYLSTKIVILK